MKTKNMVSDSWLVDGVGHGPSELVAVPEERLLLVECRGTARPLYHDLLGQLGDVWSGNVYTSRTRVWIDLMAIIEDCRTN